ncbi:MAG: type I-C CRISPR-associated protein Cas8c/Csd1 [Leptolyngbyaceae cyanobacterium]
MLLKQLYDLSQRSDIKAKLPITGYNLVPVKWLVNIDLDGNLLSSPFQELGKREKRMVPDCKRSSGIKPKLLADKGDYVFGYAEADAPADKVAERHQQFKALVQQCAEVTQSPDVMAVAHFLEQWTPATDNAKLSEQGIDSSQVFTFCVHHPDGITVIPADAQAGLPKVQDFWADHLSGASSKSGSSPIMTCLVLAEDRLVEERMPISIKGIPNGQTSGTALVSANAAPFTSYGLKNSLTSPISREAGEGFGKALNHLLSDESSRFILNNDVAYVFWTQQTTRLRTQTYKNDQPSKIRAVLVKAIQGKKRTARLKANRFYGAALTASGARVVVRDWIDTTLHSAIANLISWFDAQDLVDAYGEVDYSRRYLSIYRLSRCLYRDPKKEDIARITTRLMRVAIKGGTLTHEMLTQLVKRNRAERNVTRDRAALIKLILTTQLKTTEDNPMADMYCLNAKPQFKDSLEQAAYHCGRLLAQLEEIQTQALGRGVNATLIDRFYGAASATPGKVLGKLVADAQPHLARLRKDRRGAYEALQQKLEDILCNISPESGLFPNSLNSQQQSIFALGYYHQRAQNRKDAKDGAAAKKRAKTQATAAVEADSE